MTLPWHLCYIQCRWLWELRSSCRAKKICCLFEAGRSDANQEIRRALEMRGISIISNCQEIQLKSPKFGPIREASWWKDRIVAFHPKCLGFGQNALFRRDWSICTLSFFGRDLPEKMNIHPCGFWYSKSFVRNKEIPNRSLNSCFLTSCRDFTKSGI